MKTFKDVIGDVYLDECEWLQKYAVGKVCLEIGSLYGKTAVAMAEVAQVVYCVDPFNCTENKQDCTDHITIFNDFYENTKEYRNIIPIVGRSECVLPYLIDLPIDMVFIDGLHTYEQVKTEINLLLKFKRIPPLFTFHDYDWQTVGAAVDEVLGKPDEVHRTVGVIFFNERNKRNGLEQN